MNKELTPLEAYRKIIICLYGGYGARPEEQKIVETALKALEIIKEKNVNTFLVYQCKNYIEYNKALANQGVVGARHFNLTKEEFDLLKEALK